MSDDPKDIVPAALRIFRSEFARVREQLVPAAFQILFEPARRHILYGGRASGKSWSVARVLLVQAYERPLRVLCCREFQSSVRESALRLLADQVQLLGLTDHFTVRADSIIGRNGSEFIFEGLRFNDSRLRSLEAVDVCWVEEGQSVSERSWETLGPTVLRKPGSRLIVTFNPMGREDPVHRRFVENPPPSTLVRKVSYVDNPYFSNESEAERLWLETVDPDAHRHVWLGFPRTVSDALILKGKYAVEEFVVNPAWAGPYHGLDYGFSRDPAASLRSYIDDATRTLYVDAEFWQLGCDIDALPDALEAAIPGISRHVVYADSARPESTSYLARNGIPGVRSAEKWPGSVDDGIAYLRAFSRIVIDPSCKHFIDEAGSYSFRCDRLTGAPLPEPEDKNNHLIDALRYALSPLIRNLPGGGYFNRAALLVNGEPIEASEAQRVRPLHLFATIGACERPGTAVGLIWWAFIPYQQQQRLRLLDYDLVEMPEAVSADWFAKVFDRGRQLRAEWNIPGDLMNVHCEQGPLLEALTEPVYEYLERFLPRDPDFDLIAVESKRIVCGRTLDERADAIRAVVNCGTLLKLARSAYTREITHRAVKANALMSQVLGFRTGAKGLATELAAAFVLGTLLAIDGQT